MSEIHPLEMRDMLQKPCPVCGKPTKQQYVTASHRGNFRHGGSKLTVRPVGTLCTCKEFVDFNFCVPCKDIKGFYADETRQLYCMTCDWKLNELEATRAANRWAK